MQILSLCIREFGGLRDLSLTFEDGFNLISGDNESGKSTVIAFIRFMLYGFQKRGAGEALSDGERSFSWENGVADGSMTVKKEDKLYRIERREQAGSARKLLQIIDEETGLPVHKGEIPGVLLLGIPVQVFDSTACIRQLRSGQIDGTGLSGAIENLLLSGDETVNTEKALDNLEKARKLLLHKTGRGGEIYRLECEIAALSEELDRMRADAEALKEMTARNDECKRQIAAAEAALAKAEEQCRFFTDAQILTRFDALHTEKARRDRQRSAVNELTNRHTRNGFLPDTAYIRSLESHAQRLEADERATLRADAERRIAAESPAGDPRLIGASKAIKSAGGTSAVILRLKEFGKEIASAAILPKLFFPLGGAALLLGILLFLILQNPLLLTVSLGALTAIAGVIGISRKKRAENALTAYLKKIEFHPQTTDPVTEFAEFASRSMREEEREIHRTDRIRAAEAAVEEAAEVERNHRNDAERAAYRALPHGTPVTAAELRRLAAALQAESAERDRAEQTALLYEQNYRRMADALASYREEELRARIPEGFDYTKAENASVYQEKRDRARAVLTELENERLTAERRISALEATVGAPEENERTIEEKRAEKTLLEEQLRGILLAADSIMLARDSLKAQISPRLRRDAAKHLATLSNGRYDALSLDKSFVISGEENGRVHPSDAFSGGTKDAMYLSLRLALTELLQNGKEPFPLLLDEALAQLDDTRARTLLSLLLDRADHGGQTLFFTCHTRESEMLKDAPVHLIRLSR